MRLVLYVAKGRAKLAHALALGLAERLGPCRFAAIAFQDETEGGYLRHRTGGLFRPVLTDSQILSAAAGDGHRVDPRRIAEIERDFGAPTVWQYVIADRRLSMTRKGFLYHKGTNRPREEILAIVQARFLHVARLFEEFQPDLVLYSSVDTGQGLALVVERYASKQGVPVLVPHVSRIGRYITLNDTVYSRFAHVEERFSRLQEGGNSRNLELAQRLIEDFRKTGESYLEAYSMASGRPARVASAFGKLRRVASTTRRELLGGLRRSQPADPHSTPFRRRALDSLVTTSRRWRIERALAGAAPPRDEPFTFFPLHEEPELALLVNAPFHRDQTAIVENVAQSLPADTLLYVKEHPRMIERGLRPPGFYHRLRRIPNVRLVTGSSHELIRKSRGVVTITGTVGFEAMLLGKPAVTLGTVFFNAAAPLVWHTSDMEEVPRLVAHFKDFRPDLNALVHFVSALLDESVEVSLRKLRGQVDSEGLEATTSSASFARYLDFLVIRISRRVGHAGPATR